MNRLAAARLIVGPGLLAALLAVSLVGCGKGGPAASSGAPKNIKSSVDQQLTNLKSDNAWLRMEAAKMLAGLASQDNRIKPALQEALKKEKEAAVKKTIKAALRRASAGG